MIKNKCIASNAKIYLASGAISGFEVLMTARLMGLTSASLTNTKGARALAKTSLYDPKMEKEDMTALRAVHMRRLKIFLQELMLVLRRLLLQEEFIIQALQFKLSRIL